MLPASGFLSSSAINDVRYYLNSSKPVSSCTSSNANISGDSRTSLDAEETNLSNRLKSLGIESDEKSKRISNTSLGNCTTSSSTLSSSWSYSPDANDPLYCSQDHATDPFIIIKSTQEIYEAFIKGKSY